MNLFRKKTVSAILKQVEKDEADGVHKMGRHLGVRDLTAFGIAAIIGAGIFSTIGQASADGGPGVILLFLFTALACSFAAFCYAEFASMVPVSGSAYTYSYVAFGEMFAWIIGWALIMEYGIGNITVAISWSDYFTGLMESMNIHIPKWATMDFLSAHNGYKQAELLLHSGKSFESLDASLQTAWQAWNGAPAIGSFHFVADLPALMIIIFITWLVYRGMKESRDASNMMVVVKLAIVLLVIAVGVFYVDTDNWNPFLPNGISGVLKGVSAVFFAYIGFDAISTTAEECKNPQRDLPRGMMYAIIICTVLYISISLVLTGMVSYEKLAVGDPLAFVFTELNLKWMSGIIAVSAIFAMASVLLVFQLGQPRIWMSMSRDGLLPKKFSKLHPRYHTPAFATIVTGFVVAIPALFLNLTMVTNLCSIGTLFAFVLVCGGVLVLENKHDLPRGKFRTPYINGGIYVPLLAIIAVAYLSSKEMPTVKNFVFNYPVTISSNELFGVLDKSEIDGLKNNIAATDADGLLKADNDVEAYISSLPEEKYLNLIHSGSIKSEKLHKHGWDLFKHKIPMWIFILVCLFLTVASVVRKLSLIPVLGVVSCLYMMAQIELENWIGFSIWLIIGLLIYFSYSYKNSKLNVSPDQA
jgi:basic amino acid/polyamine antiporter, APA family